MSICLVFVVGIIFIFQAFFFSDFYEHRKGERLRNSIKDFVYKSSDWSYEEYINNLIMFELDNDVNLTVKTNDDVPLEVVYHNNTKVYKILLNTDAGKEYTVFLEKKELEDYKIDVGEKVYFAGEVYDNDKLLIFYFTKYMYEDEVVVEDESNTPIVSGGAIIKQIEQSDMTLAEYNGYIAQSFSNEDYIYSYTYEIDEYNEAIENQQYDYGTIIIEDTMTNENGEEYNIYAVATLQPVSEANSMLLEYFLYILIVVILIVIVVSIIYSRSVARPLLKLNNAANKMAHLDFSVKADVSSSNEIGDLATSLNVLSSNLKTTMDDLSKKNDELQHEINKQKKQDIIRREFVANVSHEIKTPLGVIKGYAEAIQDGINVKKHDQYIDTIINEVEKTNKLVLDMLSLSRIEEPSNNPQIQVFDINRLILDAVDMLEIVAREKQCNIIVNGISQNVVADKNMINMVLINLLSNAIKNSYIKKDIVIKSEIINNQVEIYVSNYGENISEESKENVWERFYKVDKSHTGNEGTGLGLAIVRAILEKHNSKYCIDNIKNGVVVRFTLMVE